jgi:hypothetical protein
MTQLCSIKRCVVAALAIGLLSLSSAANAITYNVDLSIGLGTATGFISTNGTLGDLAIPNITDWSLTLTASNLADGPTVTIDEAHHATQFISPGFVQATLTQLIFNFADPNSIFILQGATAHTADYLCIDSSASNCSAINGAGVHIGFNLDPNPVTVDDAQYSSTISGPAGNQLFATGLQTRLPAALPLFATGLAGLGWLARRRRKQAA